MNPETLGNPYELHFDILSLPAQLAVGRYLEAMEQRYPDLAPAETYYQHALTLAEELGMRPLQAHCHHGLGRLYSQTGRAALARAALSTAIEMYRAMDMTFWLPQAEAALAQGK